MPPTTIYLNVNSSDINTVFIGFNRPNGIVGNSGVHLLVLKKTPINIGEKLEPVDGVEPPTS